MNFTLHQLSIFLNLIEYQSITKTAEEMYLTQPAVSIQLKKFQSQFDIPLTEVVGKQLYITDFGKEIGESARRIMEEIEVINYKTSSFKGRLAGKLKISIVSTGKYVMPYFLSGFMKENRGIDLIMDVTNKARVVESLQKNEVDFSLVSVLPSGLNLNRVELLQNKLFLVGGTRLKRNQRWTIKQIFEKHPLLYREKGSATRNAMESFIQKKNLPTYKKIELTSNEALKQAVLAGLGYSIVPLIGIKKEMESRDLEIIPTKGLPIITHWNLVWPVGKKLSPVAKAFLEYIHQYKREIIRENFDWFEKY